MDYIIDVWWPGKGSAAQTDPEVALFTQSGLLTFLRGVLADEKGCPDGSKFALTSDSKGAFGPSVYVPIGEAMYQKIEGKIIALREKACSNTCSNRFICKEEVLEKDLVFSDILGILCS